MAKTLIGMYQLYGVVSDEERRKRIKAHFLERYGYEPEVVQATGGGTLVGPIHGATEMRTGEHVLTGTVEVTDA